MNNLKKILLILFIPFNIYGQKEIIEWSNTKKLTWNDFKGTIDYHYNLDDAHICYGWNKNVEIRGNNAIVNIICYFSSKESWARDFAKRSIYNLNHEQYHFNLAEAYARKMRQEISQLKIASSVIFIDSINAIYLRITKFADKEQDRYDLETDHSRNKEKQEEWNKYIDKMLKELEEWKEPTIKIILPSK